MKTIVYPNKETWGEFIQRPVFEEKALTENVHNILQDVKERGNQAIKEFSLSFDKVKLNQLQVSSEEVKAANSQVSTELKSAIQIASENIRKFHESQRINEAAVQTTEGITCWRKSVPIESVGFYIPGGSAPLFSTFLMLAIPAKIANCKRMVLCTPPQKTGEIHPAILYVASQIGITEIYKIGGAQAIAAMAFGTETIQSVNKIFGPGNQYVTKAKELIQQEGIAIDLPAGPSEVMVIADETANENFIAADLLAQAEHGTDSQVVFLSTDLEQVNKVKTNIQEQLKNLPRKAIIMEALSKSFSIVFSTLEECFSFSNLYAPEHLILSLKDATKYVDKIENAGSVFIGKYACESAGDYASGTNHTLPTNGFAKSYSGVSLDSFVKKITFQNITKQGIQNLGKTIETMAEAEGLSAHKNAVTIRLQTIKLKENESINS